LSVLAPPKSAKAYLSRAVQNFFYGAVLANPLDGDLRPFHSVTIDGREGLGGFAIVTRQKGLGPEAVNNAANDDLDWAYLAYVPADKKAALGCHLTWSSKSNDLVALPNSPCQRKSFASWSKPLQPASSADLARGWHAELAIFPRAT
jgi:hypothetical protein